MCVPYTVGVFNRQTPSIAHKSYGNVRSIPSSFECPELYGKSDMILMCLHGSFSIKHKCISLLAHLPAFDCHNVIECWNRAP